MPGGGVVVICYTNEAAFVLLCFCVTASHKASKSKWAEAEVQAVEKHLMDFIRRHRVPQKYDCIQCLDAEPRALRARSWKGVKDYVRNRITTLRRQSGGGGVGSAGEAAAGPKVEETLKKI